MGNWLNLADLPIVAARNTFSDDSDAITYTSAVAIGGPYTIEASFDGHFVEVDLGTGIADVRPKIMLRLADILPDFPAQGDKVTIRGVDYRVIEVQPDSHGSADVFFARD